jgi:hypothetical protein
MVVAVSVVVSKCAAPVLLGASLRRPATDCSVSATGPKGSRATAPEASIWPSRRSLAASPQVACSPVVLRWPELDDLVGFLEKSWRTGSHFLARSGVLFALLLGLVVISYCQGSSL